VENTENPLDGVHFGKCSAPLPDWREGPDFPDPDDTELSVTPADVVAILGFDPKKE